MIILKTPQEISIIKEGGKILAEILEQISQEAKPNVTTEYLNELAEKLIFKYGTKPSFKNYNKFPASLCVSINEEIVHGIPSKRKLKNGDIVSLDLGIWHKGLCTDAALTVGVGKISDEAKKIVKTTKECLFLGIEQAKINNHLGDIGAAVQNHAESFGFSVVRDLVGHGVGKKVHEDPDVLNYGRKNSGIKLERGMVLAIEPMLTAGDYQVEQIQNNGAFATKDKSLSAHFENTIAVKENGGEILTPFQNL
jgi:methionyl aminopeptidase